MRIEGDTHENCMKELIDYIQNQAKKMRTGIEFAKMKEISMGLFKRPKVWRALEWWYMNLKWWRDS